MVFELYFLEGLPAQMLSVTQSQRHIDYPMKSFADAENNLLGVATASGGVCWSDGDTGGLRGIRISDS